MALAVLADKVRGLKPSKKVFFIMTILFTLERHSYKKLRKTNLFIMEKDNLIYPLKRQSY